MRSVIKGLYSTCITGKTCLITTWACEKNFSLKELVKTHVSTVWATDHYRNDREVREKVVMSLDEWDIQSVFLLFLEKYML